MSTRPDPNERFSLHPMKGEDVLKRLLETPDTTDDAVTDEDESAATESESS
jgi:hypothetical protein